LRINKEQKMSSAQQHQQELSARIKDGKAIVGVVGLGYVGLPLVLTFTQKGFKAIGFDVDEKKIVALRKGESYIRHIPAERTKELLDTSKFECETSFERIGECDAVLLCVPTPLSTNREPDMRFVEATSKSVGKYLRKGQVVVLESTTYPGTTDDLVLKILEEESGLKAGQDFFLGYSPEREDPGNADFTTSTIPKVVSAMSPEGREVVTALYDAAFEQVVPVTTTRVAEMTKLFENIFRSVNIALVNELKVLGQRMDIDIWEVIQAAATKPFGFMPFYPGPGLGGNCIPIDPFYLTSKAREYELSTRFIELAGEINTNMPRYVISRTAEALNNREKSIKGSKVLVMGIAYKRNVDDMRESPALRIIELLKESGAIVAYHDPYVPKMPKTREYDFDMDSVELTAENLAAQDAVIIITDHTGVDYDLVVKNAKVVIDTRNATKDVKDGLDRVVGA
jgi:UDP-N-acetyl-D-glucosamine dehydrogenase